MSTASEYLQKFPENSKTTVPLALVYILFVCEDLGLRLDLDYENGKYERMNADKAWIRVQEETGYRITINMQYMAEPVPQGKQDETRQVLYPDLPSLAGGALLLLHRVLEDIDKREKTEPVPIVATT